MPINPPSTVADWAIWVVCILAIAAVVWVAVNQLGIPIPQWAITLVTIVLVACLAIWAIRMVSRA